MTVYLVHPNGDFQTLADALAAVVPGDGIAIYMPIAVSSATINVDNIALLSVNAYVPELEIVLGSGVTQFQTEGGTHFTVFGNALDNVINARAGNEVLIGGPGNDVLGFTLHNSAFNFGGIEYASYEYDPAGVTVTLFNNVGFATDGYGDSDTLWGIEGIVGSQFDDVIHGNDFDNIFIGLGGDDQMDGDLGFDTVLYDRSVSSGVVVNLATGTAMDAFGGTDTLVSIEKVVGSAFADVITGSVKDETFVGGAGDDVFDGGGGFDTLTYDTGIGGQGAINFSFLTGIVTDGLGGTDTFSNIDQVIGTGLGDTLTGDAGSNIFLGGAGADVIDGGDGIDFISYRELRGWPQTTLVDLAQGTASDGHGTQDTFSNIEGVIGSHVVDRFIGNADDNIFLPGLGDDFIDGGEGFDTVSYADAKQRVMVVGFEKGGHSNVSSSPTGFDQYTSIEKVIGSSSGDIFLAPLFSATMDGGASGEDRVGYYQTEGVTVRVDAEAGRVTKSNGVVDTLINIDYVAGTDGNDLFVASYGAVPSSPVPNSIDYFSGQGGFDVLDVSGMPVAVSGVAGGVQINIQARTVIVGGVKIYDFDGIEGIVGTSSKDNITGNFESNHFTGRAGDDVLDGGIGGVDIAIYALAAREYDVSFDESSGSYTVTALSGDEGTDTLTNIEILSFNGGVTDVAIAHAVTPVDLNSDFDGDGDDDVVFKLTASGNSVTNSADGTGGGWIGYAERAVIGTGDFNGDGDADLLFRFTDGNHSGFDSGGGGPWLGRSDRTAVAVGDFNGDGDDDVLFEFANGNKHIADVDSGNTWVGFADRSIEGVGDFDGDGDDDVLFELNAGGYVTNNVDGTGGRWLGGPNRDVAGIGDFDGDGDDDILFVLTTGGHIINDGEGGGMQWFGFTDRSVAGIGDFDGDGNDDILFLLADGNHTIISPNGVGRWIARTNNTVRDVGDYDGDGDDDILFEAPGGGFVVDQADGGAGLGMYFLDRTLVAGDPLGIGLTSDADLV